MSLASNKTESPIEYRDVNTTFNERFKWAKYTSNYSAPYTTYKWNRYTYTSRTWYCWDYYDGDMFMGSCRHGNSGFHINNSYDESCGAPSGRKYKYVSTGTFVEKTPNYSNPVAVTSTNKNAYPNNGYSGSYYYVYQSSTTTPGYYYKGNYVEDVKSTKEDAYPEDGRHNDGYWYVKIA